MEYRITDNIADGMIREYRTADEAARAAFMAPCISGTAILSHLVDGVWQEYARVTFADVEE